MGYLNPNSLKTFRYSNWSGGKDQIYHLIGDILSYGAILIFFVKNNYCEKAVSITRKDNQVIYLRLNRSLMYYIIPIRWKHIAPSAQRFYLPPQRGPMREEGEKKARKNIGATRQSQSRVGRVGGSPCRSATHIVLFSMM